MKRQIRNLVLWAEEKRRKKRNKQLINIKGSKKGKIIDNSDKIY